MRQLMKNCHSRNTPEWIKKIQEYKAKYPLTYHPESLTGPYVIEEIYKQTEGDAIIVTEGWTASDVGSAVL